jgi:hypothetical protein
MWRVSPMHTSVENFDYYVHRTLLCAQSSDSDRIRLSGSGVLKIKNCKKITAEKMGIFWIKNYHLLTLCLHKGFPSYRRSLRPSKENIEHFKT